MLSFVSHAVRLASFGYVAALTFPAWCEEKTKALEKKASKDAKKAKKDAKDATKKAQADFKLHVTEIKQEEKAEIALVGGSDRSMLVRCTC